MPINAPYNFVPLSNKVYFPDWAEKISHDLPFKDGLSGSIDLTLTAKTPLSIGDDGDDFFKLLGDKGQYAIPGSSIRGMIRNVFEIATFSKMQMVDNKTFALRDFSGSHTKDIYTHALGSDEREVGFLQLIEGKHTLIPCKYKRVTYTEYNEIVGVNLNNQVVSGKYRCWNNAIRRISTEKLNNKFTNFIENKDSFTPVFTGSIRGKNHDYIFYDEDTNNKIIVTDTDPHAWNDFLETHGDGVKGNEARARPMPWPSYWKSKYYNGERVPVFYKKDAKRLRIGLTYMLKFAGDNRVKDLIANTSPEHNSEQMDLTEAVFGRALDNEQGELSLRSRVQFGLALQINADENQKLEDFKTILSSPKASYFPNYIKQSSNPLKRGQQYATYLNGENKAEIRGRKIYPVTNKEAQQDNNPNNNVAVTLRTLAKGTEFKTIINFHNLRPIELGALLWSINLDNRLHTLGGGKPKQLGHTKINITDLNIFPNNPNKIWNQEKLINSFKTQMTRFTQSTWDKSDQIQTLLAAKTPKNQLKDLDFKGQLKHMELTEFAGKKNQGKSLQAYIAKKPLPPIQTPKIIIKGEFKWMNAKVHKVKNQLKITYQTYQTQASMDMIKDIMLNKKMKKQLNNGTLYLDIVVKSYGNQHTVKEIKEPQA